jgi:hypothetical protein
VPFPSAAKTREGSSGSKAPDEGEAEGRKEARAKNAKEKKRRDEGQVLEEPPFEGPEAGPPSGAAEDMVKGEFPGWKEDGLEHAEEEGPKGSIQAAQGQGQEGQEKRGEKASLLEPPRHGRKSKEGETEREEPGQDGEAKAGSLGKEGLDILCLQGLDDRGPRPGSGTAPEVDDPEILAALAGLEPGRKSIEVGIAAGVIPPEPGLGLDEAKGLQAAPGAIGGKARDLHGLGGFGKGIFLAEAFENREGRILPRDRGDEEDAPVLPDLLAPGGNKETGPGRGQKGEDGQESQGPARVHARGL